MKFKEALLALVASIGLVAPVAALSAGKAQAANEIPKITYTFNSSTPKVLREKWYFPGKGETPLTIKKDSRTALWSGSGVPESITGKWQKLGKSNYRLSTVEHYKGGVKSPVSDRYFKVKKVANHHKRYSVLIYYEKYGGKLYEPKTAYSARFNRPLSKKTAYSILKKCHLSKKVSKSVIKNIKER